MLWFGSHQFGSFEEPTSNHLKMVPVQSHNSLLDQRSWKVIVWFHRNHVCTVWKPCLPLFVKLHRSGSEHTGWLDGCNCCTPTVTASKSQDETHWQAIQFLLSQSNWIGAVHLKKYPSTYFCCLSSVQTQTYSNILLFRNHPVFTVECSWQMTE